ncbi:MAG: VCBS repeat-containing protein [Nitrospirota bacterium]
MRRGTEDRKQKSEVRSPRLKLILWLIFVIFVLFTAHSALRTVYAGDNPLDRLRDETVSFFKPLTGKIIMVKDREAVIDLGTTDSVRPGMRLNIVREVAPFKHPVTKEVIGNMESFVGLLEIKETGMESSSGEIIEGYAKEGDKVRISEAKVNMLFCVSKDTDWNLADSYYRNLKKNDRFNLIDTGIETDDPAKIIIEAKRLGAEVALFLTDGSVGSEAVITQRLFWVSDGCKFHEMSSNIETAFKKNLKFGEEFFSLDKEDTRLNVGLPFNARLITTGDIDGDGKEELIFSTGKDIRIYTSSADPQPALGGIKIDGTNMDNHLWLDSIDLNSNGRNEIIITSMKHEEVISYIYELSGTEFILLYKGDIFLRKIEDKLIAQAYSHSEGFKGAVFEFIFEGEYKNGKEIKLPANVNIYDFIYIDASPSEKLMLAYDEKGFLNLYDDKNTRLWKSNAATGGSPATFTKSAPSIMVERGEWAIKDRFFLIDKDIFFVKRIPFLEMVKGLGYKSYQIRTLRWNGLSMEENILIDEIDGSFRDYLISGDKIMILVKPKFGSNFGNILKGKSLIRSVLYVQPIKESGG